MLKEVTCITPEPHEQTTAFITSKFRCITQCQDSFCAACIFTRKRNKSPGGSRTFLSPNKNERLFTKLGCYQQCFRLIRCTKSSEKKKKKERRRKKRSLVTLASSSSRCSQMLNESDTFYSMTAALYSGSHNFKTPRKRAKKKKKTLGWDPSTLRRSMI